MNSSNSVRRKVSFAVFAAIGVSLALSAVGLGVYEYKAAETRLRSSMETLSDALLANVVSAVDFEVPEAATEVLGRLQRGDTIQAAWLFQRPTGEPPRVFARFVRPGRQPVFRPADRPDGFYVEGDRALLVTSFVRDRRAVASLQLEGSLDSVRRGLGEMLRILGVIFAVLVAVGALLARVLQRAITEPIMKLADTARAVRTSENYGLRAPIGADDEIGQLGRQFNELLASIVERDRRLAESGAFQNAILASSGVAVISTWPDGIVRSFNPAAERLLGYIDALASRVSRSRQDKNT
jgi:HAMP domain-containing protein